MAYRKIQKNRPPQQPQSHCLSPTSRIRFKAQTCTCHDKRDQEYLVCCHSYANHYLKQPYSHVLIIAHYFRVCSNFAQYCFWDVYFPVAMRCLAGYVTEENRKEAGKRLGNRLKKTIKKEKLNRLLINNTA